MADSNDTDPNKAETSAENAYAAAAEAIGEKRAESPPADVAKPERTPETKGSEPAAVDVTPPAKPRRAKAAAKPKPAKPVAKSAVKRAAAKAGKPAAAKATVQKIKTAPKAAPKIAKSGATAAPLITQLKEIPMDVTASIKDAVNGAQDKAKEAFAKTSAAAGEYGEFAKGNVEAFVESGKILASGLQSLGNTFLADSKAAFETATADVKALSGVKSPTDFIKLQSEILRRNLDTAIAYGSKNSEAMLKLTNEVIAPISGRVSLAVEKVKKAA